MVDRSIRRILISSWLSIALRSWRHPKTIIQSTSSRCPAHGRRSLADVWQAAIGPIGCTWITRLRVHKGWVWSARLRGPILDCLWLTTDVLQIRISGFIVAKYIRVDLDWSHFVNTDTAHELSRITWVCRGILSDCLRLIELSEMILNFVVSAAPRPLKVIDLGLVWHLNVVHGSCLLYLVECTLILRLCLSFCSLLVLI